MSAKPAVTLDMSGLSCPAPLIGAKKIVDAMETGQSLLLVSNCPGTSDDLFAWSRQTGNEVTVKDRMGEGRTAYLIIRGSGGRAPAPNVTLDLRGVSCPGPILEAKKLLDALQPGQVLLLVSNCPGTPADVDAWVGNTAVELLERIEAEQGIFKFYLRRR